MKVNDVIARAESPEAISGTVDALVKEIEKPEPADDYAHARELLSDVRRELCANGCEAVYEYVEVCIKSAVRMTELQCLRKELDRWMK